MKNKLIKTLICLSVVGVYEQSYATEKKIDYVPVIVSSQMDEFPVDNERHPEPKNGEKFYYSFNSEYLNKTFQADRYHHGIIRRDNGELAFLKYYLSFIDHKKNIKNYAWEQACNLEFIPNEKDKEEVIFKIKHIYDVTPVHNDQVETCIPKFMFDFSLKSKLRHLLQTKEIGDPYARESRRANLVTYDDEKSPKRDIKKDVYTKKFSNRMTLCAEFLRFSKEMSFPNDITIDFIDKFDCLNKGTENKS